MIDPTGVHLRLLMSQPQKTEPVETRELMTTEIPTYLGAPLLPPVEPVRYTRRSRSDRFMSWIDHSRSATVAVYGSAVLAVAVEAALLAAWR